MRPVTQPTRTAVRTTGLAAALTLALTGCTEDVAVNGGANPASATDDTSTLGHVHGLGIDPADDTLYIASHMGVFRRTDDGELHRVADRWQDTMAFTIAGPNHFIASGHPDLREDLPPHLGLIESTDAARTWQPLSLQGQADFHALEIAGNQTYGYDAAGERLLVSSDRLQWEELDDINLVDIAVDPDAADGAARLVATTPTGELLDYGLGPRGEPVAPQELEGPPLVFLDWADGDSLVGLAPDGAVYHSGDRAQSWQRTSAVPGQAQALEAATGGWYVATSHGVYLSTDAGRSWTPVVTHGGEAHTG